MQRMTVSIPDDVAEAFESWSREKGYQNRSEAFRDLVREACARRAQDRAIGRGMGVLSYVYDHHERRLSERMTEHQHEAGELVHSVMHVHVTHDECLEAVFLKGEAADILTFAKSVLSQPGVKHGQFNFIPQGASPSHHDHAHTHDHDHGHTHEH